MTLRSVGTAGGQAAAFTYDLARSVVQTRQGNPAWAGQKRDGQIDPIRSDDLFFPNWVDLGRVAIPQADEQQRLLANLVTQHELRPRAAAALLVLPARRASGRGDDGRRPHGDRDGGPLRSIPRAQPGRLLGRGLGLRALDLVRLRDQRHDRRPGGGVPGAGLRDRPASRYGLRQLHRGFAARKRGPTSVPSSWRGGRASSRRRGPTAPTASPGATGRASRRSGTSSGSGWTRTTTTGPAAGCRTGRGCSRAPASPCGSPTSTAR